VHFLGTSGTVTTIAGVMLGLERYDRKRVDGIWLGADDIEGVTSELLGWSYDERVLQPCIGRERADLVLAGCAILDAILKLWPADRLRVADRGLREGILMRLMMEDGVWRAGRRRRGRGRRARGGSKS
jgi:exopolyphosphatase/guanosine-5'-triphosphate,3'-diphosphate pyrophosphatase